MRRYYVVERERGRGWLAGESWAVAELQADYLRQVTGRRVEVERGMECAGCGRELAPWEAIRHACCARVYCEGCEDRGEHGHDAWTVADAWRPGE